MIEAERTSNKSLQISRFERLPEHIIERVILNEKLIDETTDPRLKRFSDPDYLLDKSAFFAVGYPLYGATSDLLKVQSPSSHRAFTQRFGSGFSDEYNNVYGQISVKGVGTTRRDVNYYRQSDPKGLFGERHAVQDMYVSDVFAAHGGRTSRGVAILTLNHEALQKWHADNDSSAYNLPEALEIVENNGDIASLYVRLIGSDRFEDFVGSGDGKTRDHMVTRAMRVVAEEVHQRGLSGFQEKYFIKSDVVMVHLTKALESQNPSSSYQALSYMYTHFFNFNKGVGKVVSREHFEGKLKFNVHFGNQDLTGMWIDWENALPESDQQMESLSAVATGHVFDFQERQIRERIAAEGYEAGLLVAKEICRAHEGKIV